MVSWLKIAFQTIKVFVLFTGCTILFYYGIMWLNEEYQDYHRYDEPKGAAVKVSASANNSESSNWLDRLILFYLNGE
ncbi:YqzK family protein [Bacillus sp. DTU_2020_1000418_1_SI_GHA_SEK_038]|uniref:YqzK family protein n=1 Tax=Bacillus sp. DTU_2020_1000418_1_SI_GHA_SEK_038 TaxID=3077585 RepID=UPI0028ED1196|nr:YqzK family protein [Bacillus sp. DTU_2020_1000418_1_SI_GHA_SEK_038]WNS74107.1 YqzK family protein [Bacillus sp. DTU_2020_1000418_1_SI_GHA_SEK_038]